MDMLGIPMDPLSRLTAVKTSLRTTLKLVGILLTFLLKACTLGCVWDLKGV